MIIVSPISCPLVCYFLSLYDFFPLSNVVLLEISDKSDWCGERKEQYGPCKLQGWHARNCVLGLDLDLNFAHFLDKLDSNRGDFASFQSSSSKPEPNSTSDTSQAELGSPVYYTKFSGLARLEGSSWALSSWHQFQLEPNSACPNTSRAFF